MNLNRLVDHAARYLGRERLGIDAAMSSLVHLWCAELFDLKPQQGMLARGSRVYLIPTELEWAFSWALEEQRFAR